MPTANDYAEWIVKNQSKKGTSEFQTVAAAYEQTKKEESLQEYEPSWMTAISRGIGRIPGQISDIATSVEQLPSALSQVYTPSNIAEGLKLLGEPETYQKIGEAGSDILRAPIERYGTTARAKETISTDPLGAMMDVSLVGRGTGTALRLLPQTARAGKALESAAEAIDPLSMASRVVTKPFREISDIRRIPGTDIGVPTREQLQQQATNAYQRAKNAGVVYSPQSFDDLVINMRSNLQDAQGNTVRIVPELHTKSDAALRALERYKGGPQSLSDLDEMRQILKDAASSVDPADRRVAMMLRDKLDEFVDSPPQGAVVAGKGQEGSEALRQARDFYSRLRKSDVIEDLIKDAELSAPNFSGSGMENALRTQFRNLAKNDRKMRLFTQEERAAIEAVAKGSGMANAMRFIGRFAPTGVVSGSLSGGAGGYFGFLAGGPVGAGIGAAAVPAVGMAGRLGATALTKSAATRAGDIARAGRQGATTGQRLGYLLEKFGDKLSQLDPSAAFLVDRTRRAIELGQKVDPYYARQLAAQLARLEEQEQE
jgi:hypothetical protein